MPPPSPLIAFYAGTGTDHRGRRLAEILAWDDAQLEQVHDYIQWLFPLTEPSGFNPSAPLLTAADIAAFAEQPALRPALRAALRRMLAFYGFELTQAGLVRPAPDHARRQATWLTRNNHNLLRITRILRCLRLLELKDEARAFGHALQALYDAGAGAAIGPTTLRFWQDALADR